MKCIICNVAFLVLLQTFLYAQPENYKIYNINRDNGLLSDHVESVHQDKSGFLWAATFEGLSKWDGFSFKNYQHYEKDSTSILHNIVYSIAEDKKGRLWIGTIEGLNLYDRQKDHFIKIELKGSIDKIPVNVIKVDSKNRLWIGTSIGLCMYDHEKGILKWYLNDPLKETSISEDVVFALDIDKQDNIWVGTFHKGINKLTPSSNQIIRMNHNENGLCSNKIKTIFVDSDQKIWVGTFDKGINVLDNQGNVLKHYEDVSETISGKNQKTVLKIYQDKNNYIWAGIENEPLKYLDVESDKFTSFTNPPYKKSDMLFGSVSSIFEDDFGNIWFSSQGSGLFYSNSYKNKFKHHYQKNYNGFVKDQLNGNIISSIYEDSKGMMWFGTDGGGLTQFNPEENTYYTYTKKDGLRSNSIHDIKEDIYGNFWFATWSGGIISFDPESGKFTTFQNDHSNQNSIISNNIKTILPDDSLLWIGTHGEGLAVLNLKTNQFTHGRNNKSYPFDMEAPSWINHLFKDSKGRLWISTYGGLHCLTGNNIIKYVHSKDENSIISNAVNMVAEDGDGGIWIITENGLDKFIESTQSFAHYSEKYNLPLILKALVFDKKGNLWLSSNEGILVFDPVTNTAKSFDVNDGLQSNQFFLKSVEMDASGTLYFGGNNGINEFHPDDLEQHHYKTRFYFKDFVIYDELQKPLNENSPLQNVLAFTEKLKLTHKQSFFTVGFSTINLYSPSKTKFAYQLEGLHDNWIQIGAERKVSFTDLSPGNYNLKIKYTDTSGNWIEADKNLAILILPPWWKTLWFKVFLVLLFSTTWILYYYRRIVSIKRRNLQLQKEVRKRTLELREVNDFLVQKNEEIKVQNERLETYNNEILRQSEKIFEQQGHIIQQNQALEKTVEELELSNSTKDKFFSILAHDLKNPVSAIAGLSNILKERLPVLDKSEIEEYVLNISNSSQSVYTLLINLLDWARTQSRNIVCLPSDVSINQLINKNILLFNQQINNKNLSIKKSIDPAHYIWADYNMMDTVFRNLLSNSIKFTANGGIISISSSENSEKIDIFIADTGIGMTAAQIEELVKIDKVKISAGTRGESGTGLGLVISKEFLDANKSDLKVDSVYGEGSVFTLSIPKSTSLHLPVFEEEKNILENSVRKRGKEFCSEKLDLIKGKKVLIVDDDKALRMHLNALLSDIFEVLIEVNGDSAYKKALEYQPDIIITDMLMPVMDGLQLCKKLKNNPSTSHIPVILLTSQSYEEGQLSGYAAGADIYLTKPVSKEMLFQVFFNIVNSQEKIRQRISKSTELYLSDFNINKLDEEFLEKVVKFIEENVSSPELNHKRLCEISAMSRTVLYAKIKSITGEGVHEFIRTIRLKKSIQLLLEGKYTVTQVAYEVGFNSVSYFIRCFIKQYNMSPKEYVSQARKNMMLPAN